MLAGGCNGDKGDTDDDPLTGTSAETNGVSSTDDATSTGDDPTTAASGTGDTTAAATGDATTGTTGDPVDTTGGEPVGDPACVAYCATERRCGSGGDALCVADCSEAIGGLDGACATANQLFLTCLAAMDCRQFATWVNGGDPGPCLESLDDAETACGRLDCVVSSGGANDGSECSHTIECPRAPTLEMQCDEQTCTCLEDGAQVGQCEAEAICEQSERGAFEAKAEACCGFASPFGE